MLVRNLIYKWNCAKLAWIHKGSPWLKDSSGVVIYGDPGWLPAWIVFSILSPKNWYGYLGRRVSWSYVRNLKNVTSPHYGDPRILKTPRMNGWKATWDMIHLYIEERKEKKHTDRKDNEQK